MVYCTEIDFYNELPRLRLLSLNYWMISEPTSTAATKSSALYNYFIVRVGSFSFNEYCCTSLLTRTQIGRGWSTSLTVI